MNARTLKIESTGDFCYGKITPKIRLGGQWLERAGFKPGCRVEVHSDQPGTLTLRFLPDDSHPEKSSPVTVGSIKSSITLPNVSLSFTPLPEAAKCGM